MTNARDEHSPWFRATAQGGAHVAAESPLVAASAPRLQWVDALRFVAAFQMLQGHTVAALLAPAQRVGVLHALWSAARGLTSVAFLFAAGLSFYLAQARGHSSGWRRGLGLIGLGYLLHLPLMAALAGAPPPSAAWRAALNVDVLQCIGVGLLALRALALFQSEPLRLARTCGALALGVLALSPLAARLPLGVAPAWLEGYFSARTGSLFPLLPWSAHMLAGVACGPLVAAPASQPDSASRPLEATSRLALLGVGLLALGTLHGPAALSVVLDHVTRLGWVIGGCALLAALPTPRGGRGFDRALRTLSRETLFLYVFHVLLVYGDRLGLAARIGPTLDPLGAIGAALGVVALSFAAALGYRRLLDAIAAGRARRRSVA